MADKHMQRCSISSASSEMQIKTTMSYYFIATGMAILKKDRLGTSLAVQWLRLHTPNAGGPGSIPVQGTRSHMPQRRSHMRQLRPGTAKYIN